jgi:hypothetical protein
MGRTARSCLSDFRKRRAIRTYVARFAQKLDESEVSSPGIGGLEGEDG